MLNVKTAKHEDLIELANFVNSAYRGETSKVGWTTEADLLGGQRTDPDLLQTYIQGKDQVILLFLKEEKIQGCVYLRNENPVVYLGMLTVDPDLQRSGIGKYILQFTQTWAKENWKSKIMRMTVISVRKELIDWYVRKGFSLTNEKEKFPYGDERFGIPKRQDLEFVVLKKNLD